MNIIIIGLAVFLVIAFLGDRKINPGRRQRRAQEAERQKRLYGGKGEEEE